MRFTLLTQIALITLSIVMFLGFIKPSFATIKEKQDENFRYTDTLLKAEELNRELESLIARRNAFSAQDMQLLNTFLPQRIDQLKVMRDIEALFLELKKPLITLTVSEGVPPTVQNAEVDPEIDPQLVDATAGQVVNPLASQDYQFTFVGEYLDLKNFLSMLEMNETLLEVVSLSVTPMDARISDEIRDKDIPKGQFTFAVTVRTYGLSL